MQKLKKEKKAPVSSSRLGHPRVFARVGYINRSLSCGGLVLDPLNRVYNDWLITIDNEL